MLFCAPVRAAESVRAYDIPAGPLTQTLNRFGRESGVLLSFSSAQTDGLRSPGVTGSHSVPAALRTLLSGTGLEAAAQADGGYVLRSATGTAAADVSAAESAPVLSGVRVTEDIVEDATEGSGSYTTSTMSTATRLPLTMRETPQSVTVITRDRMDDLGMQKASDAMATTPGVATTSISGPNREVYYSRGFMVSNYTFDGLPATFSDAGGQALVNDLSIYDRVEIVRGSAGLTQGAGTPSAAVNFVRKRPTARFQASTRAHLGSWNHFGLEADISGPLTDAGSLRGRVVANWWQSDSFQDVAEDGRKLLYLIGEADLGPDTLATLSVSHLKSETNTTYAGLPTGRFGEDLHLPRSTFLGNDWTYWDETNTSAFASLVHRFGDDWKLAVSINQIWGTQDRFVVGNSLDATGNYDQSGGRAAIDNDRTSFDVNVLGAFNLLGRRHELTFGGGGRTSRDRDDVAGYWPPIYLAEDMDIYNWTHDAPKPATVIEDLHAHTREKQNGVYATTRLNIADPLKLIAGLRVDWYDFESGYDIYDWDAGTWTLYPGGFDYKGHVTKYGGIVFDVGALHSLYASYSDIFQPQDARNDANEYIVPVVGRNYELGVKGEYLEGALNLSAAIFRVDQDNLAIEDGPCPSRPTETCYRAAGQVRSEGFDVEIQGALASNWQVGGGYSRVNTRIRKDADPGQVGVRQNTQLPRDQFKLSTTWQLGKWRAGANLLWQGEVSHFDDWMGYDYSTRQKAYAVVDALFGYRHDTRLDLQLNVSNLLDKVYYRVINTQPAEWGGNAMYGAPRRFMLTARYAF